MKDDADLLRHYCENGSGEAFAELVQRHIGLVYSAALRRLGGDTHLAEDVTQQVFTDLAKKACSLREHRTLAGWLFVAARAASASVVRGERRRKSRELHAEDLLSSSMHTETDLSHLQPALDEIIANLRSEEREAIILRFFEQRSFAEIGAALSVTEEAARKRVERALEKLQALFASKGIVSTATALSVALGALGVASVPAGLASKITGAAVGGGATAAGGAALGTYIAAVVPAGVVLVASGLLLSDQYNTNRRLAAERSRQSTALQTAIDRSEAAHQSPLISTNESDERRILKSEIDNLRTSLSKPIPTPARAHPTAVTVSPRGQLRWGDKPVTLDEYLAQTRLLRDAIPGSETGVNISAMGARLSQLAWTLDEARKANIDHIVVDSDAAADPTLPQSWF